MAPLFKFIEREHLEGFFSTGSLRLGTVHDFKDVVEYGASRGDQREGLHSVARRNKGVLKLQSGQHEPIISELVKFEGSGEVTFHGGTFVINRVSPDYFIFCTSRGYSEHLFRQWHQEVGADTCYVISNPAAFAREVSSAITTSAYFAGAANISYIGDDIDYQAPEAQLSPAITKLSDEYGWQIEHRMLWSPRLPTPRLKPWVIQVPAARQYCKPFRCLKNGVIHSHENL